MFFFRHSVCKRNGYHLLMPAKNNPSANTLLQNPQKAVIITTNICFLTNFTELELTNVQANYWGGQMYCGPPTKILEGPWPPWPPRQRPSCWGSGGRISHFSIDLGCRPQNTLALQCQRMMLLPVFLVVLLVCCN